jgi:S1-C subfamily serine protease
MELPETFEIIRPSIVALGSKLDLIGGYPFPTIVGTGFVVDERGIILTNRHVAEALQSLPRHPETGEETAVAFVFSEVNAENGEHALRVNRIEVKAYSLMTRFDTAGPFYGEAMPDLAFLQLAVKGLRPLQIASEAYTLRVGLTVATAGFPLGTDALLLNNRIVQLTPLLRHGIVSSLYPFPCPNPHGFTLDIMIQGGASGSPIFLRDEPLVVGMLYAGLGDSFEVEGRRIQIDTNITLALPGKLLGEALRQSMPDIEKLDLRDVPTLESLSKD